MHRILKIFVDLNVYTIDIVVKEYYHSIIKFYERGKTMVLPIILFIIATVPGVILFIMTRKLDKKEKESKKILIKIILIEILFLIPTILAEFAGEAIMQGVSGADRSNLLFIAALCFLVIGPAEELFKFLGAKLPTWKSPEFNCKFDGIVYCTTSALTFALIENLGYVFTSGSLATAIMRAICCFPGHFMYGVLMGVFYTRARICMNNGDKKGKRKNFFLAILVPALIHGLYDTLAFSFVPLAEELEYANGIYEAGLIVGILVCLGLLILVVVGTYITLFVVIIKSSKSDKFIAPIYPLPQQPAAAQPVQAQPAAPQSDVNGNNNW